jgi:hypothetical protein
MEQIGCTLAVAGVEPGQNRHQIRAVEAGPVAVVVVERILPPVVPVLLVQAVEMLEQTEVQEVQVLKEHTPQE